MRLPIDTSAVNFVAAGAPEPAVDYDTKSPKTDETGRPIFNVHLFAVGGGGRDVITVKVAGEPKGIGEFTPVKGLFRNQWGRDDAIRGARIGLGQLTPPA